MFRQTFSQTTDREVLPFDNLKFLPFNSFIQHIFSCQTVLIQRISLRYIREMVFLLRFSILAKGKADDRSKQMNGKLMNKNN